MSTQHKTYSAVFFLILLLLTGLWSCQKVINVDLNSASPKIVIDGNVTDQPGPYTVTLSQTVNFDETNIFPPVSGALIVINDNTGTSDTLKETTPGTYQTSKLQGVSGRTYTLTVVTNNITYTATSSMPMPVEIDTLTLKNSPRSTKKLVSVTFTDPAGISNYYHFVEQIINIHITGKPYIPTLGSVTSDRLLDGTERSFLLGRGATDLTAGDSVLVSLQCVDKNVYNYFRTAQQQGDMSTTLSNPVSNISNGALGYFSACTVRTKMIVVTE